MVKRIDAMRIIGGTCRSRIIKMPKGVEIRPTQDRVREAIFNIIKAEVYGSSVLDLYAGSGAFGIESLSRGAYLSIFVDNNKNCIKTIKSNLLVLGEKAKLAQVLNLEALTAINRLKKEDKKFDIVFLDPPYYKDLAKNSLIKIDACDILSHCGFVIVEHFKKDVLPDTLSTITLFKRRKYGDTRVSFYTHI